MQSFYWYDLETSGTFPATDRIMQFAGQRTDFELNPVEAPFTTYVQLPLDVLPSPEACLVTSITPQIAAGGLDERRAALAIQKLFSAPETCVAGYNNLRFDDEFIRYALYRNLLDPYEREWRNGNSRWDLIDVARAASALRPHGIEWPVADNQPSYRLDALAQANRLEAAKPHDALSDVQTTIAFARLLKAKQPDLFRYALSHRSKRAAQRLLQPIGERVLMHASGRFPNVRQGTAPVVSVAMHPEQRDSIIVADLGRDVASLVEGDADELREALFGAESEGRPPLKQVRLNRCPFLAPIRVLRREDAQRLGLDAAEIEARHAALRRVADLDQKVANIYRRGERLEGGPERDAEERLYEGFPPDQDRNVCAMLHNLLEDGAPWPSALRFEDQRLTELARRLRWRSLPNSLPPAERERWRQFIARRLVEEHPRRITAAAYRAQVEALLQQAASEGERAILRELEAWGREAQRRVAP